MSASIPKESCRTLSFCIETMPHHLFRAFVTEHHIHISVVPQRRFQASSTVPIGPFYVEMVEVTTRHSGCQQQHLMWR